MDDFSGKFCNLGSYPLVKNRFKFKQMFVILELK